MIKIFSATLLTVLIVLMYALASSFEHEQKRIEQITKKYKEDIKKLDKIAQINTWLDTIAKLKVKTLSENEAEHHLVSYFDDHAKAYNFKVNRYIYDEATTKNLVISYEVERNNSKSLMDLMSTHYKNGFLQFKSLEMDPKSIKGEIQLIQPYNGENNAS